MSMSKGGQRQIEKKSPRSLLGTWRQGLSAPVKRYYLERKEDPMEREILPYRRYKRTKTCKITKAAHVFDHYQQSGATSRWRVLRCRCGKWIDSEYKCSKCERWGTHTSLFRPCGLCENSIKTSDEPVPCASLTNEGGKS